MEKGKLTSEEVERYKSYKLTTISNCQNYLRLISNVYFEVIRQTQTLQQELEGIQNYFAKITMQMFFTKALVTNY